MSTRTKTSIALVAGMLAGSAGTAQIVTRDPAYRAIQTAHTAVQNTTTNPLGPRLVDVIEHDPLCMEGIRARAVHGDQSNPQALQRAMLEVLVKSMNYRQHVVTNSDGWFILPLPAGVTIDVYFVGFVRDIADEYPAEQFVRIESFSPPGGCVPLYSQRD